MFIDVARVKIKAGNGGDGVVSFHTEKYINAGGPDGGDGGRGGDVIFVADDNVSTLADFKFKRKYIAENGARGGGNNCTGRGAENLIVKVPRGTLIKDAETGRIMADISGDEPRVIAAGGKGGKGNAKFATPTRQIPRFAKPGFPGEEYSVTLELKLLADVGLVGFPNVGKSTLISVVSAAKPKIANYHFTTLSPVLGVVSLGEHESYVMADIPGLIEGAAEGVGLGHDFLRHVERCRLILHIVDVSGCEGRDPKDDFEKINNELRNFNEDMSERPMIVAANKSDLATPEQIAEFKEFIESKGLPFFEISAATVAGTKQLVYAVYEKLKELPPITEYEAEPIPIEMLSKANRNTFEITNEDGVYVIEAPWLAQVLGSVNMEDYESLQYFQRVLHSSGIIDKLEEMGINENDTVSIFGYQFDYLR